MLQPRNKRSAMMHSRYGKPADETTTRYRCDRGEPGIPPSLAGEMSGIERSTVSNTRSILLVEQERPGRAFRLSTTHHDTGFLPRLPAIQRILRGIG